MLGATHLTLISLPASLPLSLETRKKSRLFFMWRSCYTTLLHPKHTLRPSHRLKHLCLFLTLALIPFTFVMLVMTLYCLSCFLCSLVCSSISDCVCVLLTHNYLLLFCISNSNIKPFLCSSSVTDLLVI